MQGECKETTATQSQSGRSHKVCKSRLNNSSTPKPPIALTSAHKQCTGSFWHGFSG